MLEKIKNILASQSTVEAPKQFIPKSNYNLIKTDQGKTDKQINEQQTIIDSMRNDFVCLKCKQYLKFAYTLVQCGHTFCRQCIFSEIKHKGVFVCPYQRCDASIYMNDKFESVLIKDLFKQNIANTLIEKENKRDQKVLNAISQALAVDIDKVLSIYEQRQKQPNANQDYSIKESNSVCDYLLHHYFNQITNIDKLMYVLPPLISVRPLSQKDYSYIGVEYQVKYQQNFIQYFRYHLEKCMNERGISNKDIPAKASIILFMNEQQLKNQNDLIRIINQTYKDEKKKDQLPTIYYQLKIQK